MKPTPPYRTRRIWFGSRLGLTNSSPAAAVIDDKLVPAISCGIRIETAGSWSARHRTCCNTGTKGLAMRAISAVDIALWDLRARLLEVSLGSLFGAVRDAAPVHGPGGFIILPDRQLAEQVEFWTEAGCTAMKIKIGQDWGAATDRDLHGQHISAQKCLLRCSTARRLRYGGLDIVRERACDRRGQWRYRGTACAEQSLLRPGLREDGS